MLGLYALSVMEREGPVYGYQLVARIAERTSGGWTPGPGAIYPALGRLVRRGLCTSRPSGRRRVYRITAQGARTLREVRQGMKRRSRLGPDIGILWSEIAGYRSAGSFLLDRLRSHVDRSVAYFLNAAPSTVELRQQRRRAEGLLRSAAQELRDGDQRLPSAAGRPRSSS